MTLSSYWVQVTVPRDEGASDEPNRLIELARSTLGDKEALQNVVKCPEDFSASVDSEVDVYEDTLTLTALLNIETTVAAKLDKAKLTKMLRGSEVNSWGTQLTVEKRVVCT